MGIWINTILLAELGLISLFFYIKVKSIKYLISLYILNVYRNYDFGNQANIIMKERNDE